MAETSDTAPLKTVAHRLFTALTIDELGIAVALAVTVIFAADRLSGAIG